MQVELYTLIASLVVAKRVAYNQYVLSNNTITVELKLSELQLSGSLCEKNHFIEPTSYVVLFDN